MAPTTRDPEALAVHHDSDIMADDLAEKKISAHESPPENDPFGNEECGEVKYRVMKWWHCGICKVPRGFSPNITSIKSQGTPSELKCDSDDRGEYLPGNSVPAVGRGDSRNCPVSASTLSTFILFCILANIHCSAPSSLS